MFCKNCGKPTGENTKFCKFCGVRVATSGQFVYKPQNSAFSKFNFRKYLFNRYIAILIGVFFVVWISASDHTSYNGGATLVPLPAPVRQAPDTSVEITPLAPAISLANGTILKRNKGYFIGDGKLEIKNGTSLDAVAKLIHGGTSVLTVFIKANSTYTMIDIPDGVFWLVFAQGTDWNSATQKFNRSTQYSSFDETFDFTTTEDAEYYHYSSYEVTLNPVVGGTAQTSSVNPGQFDAY